MQDHNMHDQNTGNEREDQKTKASQDKITEQPLKKDEQSNEQKEQGRSAQSPPAPMEKLQKQCEEYLAGWKRAQADYQNLMKDVAKQKEALQKFAGAHVIQDFLPLVDYFKYAFAPEIPEEYKNSQWMQGIKNIQTYLNKILADHGIEEIKTVGKALNPQLHEAIEEITSEGVASGTIVEEVSTGFMQHSKVIKHAKVKIAK